MIGVLEGVQTQHPPDDCFFVKCELCTRVREAHVKPESFVRQHAIIRSVSRRPQILKYSDIVIQLSSMTHNEFHRLDVIYSSV